MANPTNNPRAEFGGIEQLYRLRITFAKTAAMRFTGHLDLHQAWERTFRRAGLALAYSHGFNQRPRLQLASALPLGFTSQAELLDVWLEEELNPDEIMGRLSDALPPGLKVYNIETVDLKEPALQTVVEAAEFTATFLEPLPELLERVEQLLAAESLPRTRRKRDYDLRLLIQSLEMLSPEPDNNARLHMRLSAQEGATGRPEEVIEALGADVNNLRIERTRLLFRSTE